MSLIFTQLASYSFVRPDVTPLDPTFWTTLDFPPPAEPLSVVSNKCVCLTSASNLNVGGAEFIGVVLPDNQYVDFTIDTCTAFGFIGTGIRSNTASSVGYEVFITGPLGDSVAIELDHLGDGTLASTVTPIHSGDTIRLAAFGSSLFVFVNGVEILTAIDSGFSSGTTFLEMVDEIDQNDVKVSSYAVGSVSSAPAFTPYSVPDCRVAPFGPNTGVTVQGTIQYTGQTSSNSSIPPTDSRAAGAPADSRVSPNIPQNSRNNPPF